MTVVFPDSLMSSLLSLAAPFVVFLGVFSFLYASLGKSRMFHFESKARLVLSFALAFFASRVVNWSQIVMVTATAVSLGLTALVFYHVGLQRGKTKHESLEAVEDQSIREFVRRRRW